MKLGVAFLIVALSTAGVVACADTGNPGGVIAFALGGALTVLGWLKFYGGSP